jgi:outer membrane protein
VKKEFAIFLGLLFASSAPLAEAQEKIKIGYIDIQKAISESNAGKKARERFQVQVKKAEADLLKEKNDVERLKSDFDKKAPLMKDEERKNMEKELQRRLLVYQRSMQDSQQDLRQKEGEMTAEILKDLEKVVTDYGKSEKFTLIVERSQILYHDHAIDVTDRVIEIYNIGTGGKVTKSK